MVSKFANYILAFCFLASGNSTYAQTESDYYEIIDVAIPDNVILEVGGLAFGDKNNLGVTTRRGELWIIDDPYKQKPVYSRFAHGLHEPLGLAYKNGNYYLSQRGELTKLSDTNKDGKADIYETITSWPLAGNYHEYSYGPKFLPNGDMLVTLNLGWIGRGASLSKWRGWMIKVTKDGKIIPYATGMRSPAGYGFNKNGDIFYAENQGDWVGSGRITHLEEGDFAGHPDGLKWASEPESPVKLKMEDIKDEVYSLYEHGEVTPGVKPPSVWFPHTLMGISTSEILFDNTNGKFGPFSGQLFVGDQGHSKIMRVYQEKVNGVYQGACFPFREGFSSGVLRMIWGKDGSMFSGMTSRGWNATGKSDFGLQRLKWTGKTPFEIKEIHARPDGFELVFTKRVNKASIQNPNAFSVIDFTYLYHHNYGSPVVEKETRHIYHATVSDDGLKVRLYVDGLRKGFINEIKAPGVLSADENPLLHLDAYYTLNQIPEGHKMPVEAGIFKDNTIEKTSELSENKRINEIPASWNGKVDYTFKFGVVPGLKYDVEEIKVKAGSKVKIVFNNNDDMLHNMVITKPGSATKVGEMAAKLGLDGHEKNYVPNTKDVLYHTNIIEPNQTDSIFFIAPSKPGIYEYVCTYPGHYMSMRGRLVVE